MRKLATLLLLLGISSFCLDRGNGKDLSHIVPAGTKQVDKQKQERIYTRQDLVDACAMIYRETLAETELLSIKSEGNDYLIITDMKGRRTRMIYFPEQGYGFRAASQPEDRNYFLVPETQKQEPGKIELPEPPKPKIPKGSVLVFADN